MRCAQAGWKVAVVEENKVWGGTCDNRGCIPKKILVGAAKVADLNRRFQGLDIVTKPVELSWEGLMNFKSTFTSPVSEETKEPLEKAGVKLYEGSPKFVNEDTLEVNGEQLTAEHFHIATGAKPAKLSVEGAEHLKTSDDFLSLTSLPKRIIFVGGGYVSFELAHVAARFGAKVTILHNDDRPLAAFDPDTVKTLIAASKEAGVEVVLNAAAEKITKTGEGVTVHAGNKEYAVVMAVHGAGRPPAIDTLDLEAANVQSERRGVMVNEYLQSVSNPRVYAGGDAAAAGPPLSPIARLHGSIVADNLLGIKTKQPDYRSTPSVVFTEPPLAMVGLTEQAVKEKGIDATVHTENMSTWFDAKRTNLTHTMAKTLVDAQTNRILGAHIVGNHAEDLINMFALAIENGLTAEQFKAPIYAFPTPSDDARYML
ncbi:pyridine nucleotide-disulphide oxidoreductase dimerisation region [candidate division TM7 genomosp. GTL1]|nr:pyridine nucleotide-disulphide oxidoreductase dimerisation region [candidate division TM7 genomosp. GTL1]